MPARNQVIGIVAEWVAKAESDLKTAALSVAAGRDSPTDTACFHCQQAVEKYLKALLTDQDYAIGPRYPGWPDIPLADARRALALGRRVRRDIRKLLPLQALRRRKRKP
jgi:HEPN domain-containing protein